MDKKEILSDNEILIEELKDDYLSRFKAGYYKGRSEGYFYGFFTFFVLELLVALILLSIVA